jgi:hypothetical protein
VPSAAALRCCARVHRCLRLRRRHALSSRAAAPLALLRPSARRAAALQSDKEVQLRNTVVGASLPKLSAPDLQRAPKRRAAGCRSGGDLDPDGDIRDPRDVKASKQYSVSTCAATCSAPTNQRYLTPHLPCLSKKTNPLPLPCLPLFWKSASTAKSSR